MRTWGKTAVRTPRTRPQEEPALPCLPLGLPAPRTGDNEILSFKSPRLPEPTKTGPLRPRDPTTTVRRSSLKSHFPVTSPGRLVLEAVTTLCRPRAPTLNSHTQETQARGSQPASLPARSLIPVGCPEGPCLSHDDRGWLSHVDWSLGTQDRQKQAGFTMTCSVNPRWRPHLLTCNYVQNFHSGVVAPHPEGHF